MIRTPEKYLLTRTELEAAEGGIGALVFTTGFMLFGIGTVLGLSPKMALKAKAGTLGW